MKKISVVLISVILILSMIVTAFGNEAVLMPEEIPAITEKDGETKALTTLGILKGTEKGMELEREVTRAEAVTFLMRMYPGVSSVTEYTSVFDDMENHWAYEYVNTARELGLVHGVSTVSFEPERTVTGKEFAKMLLSACGHSGITIENVCDKATEYELILNKFTKSIVFGNNPLTRGEVVRLCYAALFTKTDSGEMLYKELLKSGKITQQQVNDAHFGGSSEADFKTFSDEMNSRMPQDKNYMFSPLSIKMALAMAANGAEGETLEQITSALKLDDLDSFNEKSKKMIAEYSKSDTLKLNIANSIWINESLTTKKFSEEFKALSNEYYSASSFSEKSDVIANKINSWTSEKTNGKIPVIVDESAEPDFWAMLINAIYFKGSWKSEFSEDATKKDTFTDKNGVKSEIDFMNATRYYAYYADGDTEVLELPYKNYDYDIETHELTEYDLDVSMYLIKGDYSESLFTDAVKNEKMHSKYISLSVPKFKIEYSESLSGMMNDIGIIKAFKDDAEFNKMFDEGSMFITDVVHKTYIDVNEKGTEAAAVTAIGMAGSSLPPEPVEVKFNTPFTFVIYDKTNSEILFMGMYAFQ